MMTLNKKSANQATSSLDCLPVVLANWIQAMTNFHRLYGVLLETIAKRKQQTHVLMYTVGDPSNQRLLNDLERVRVETVQRLRWLVDDMNNPSGFNQEATVASIERLSSHTLQLQKQAKRIERTLGLNKHNSPITVGLTPVFTHQ